MNEADDAQLLRVMENAASELAKLGFDNRAVSELFFAYGLRLGFLTDGESVFGAARMVIDTMEKQSQ